MFCIFFPYLARNPIKDEGAISIAYAYWPNMQVMELSGNEIGPQGMGALYMADMPYLRYFRLDQNSKFCDTLMSAEDVPKHRLSWFTHFKYTLSYQGVILMGILD